MAVMPKAAAWVPICQPSASKANELTVTVYRPLEIYTILVLEYLILILLGSWLVRWLEASMGGNVQTANRQ